MGAAAGAAGTAALTWYSAAGGLRGGSFFPAVVSLVTPAPVRSEFPLAGIYVPNSTALAARALAAARGV